MVKHVGIPYSPSLQYLETVSTCKLSCCWLVEFIWLMFPNVGSERSNFWLLLQLRHSATHMKCLNNSKHYTGIACSQGILSAIVQFGVWVLTLQKYLKQPQK
jgi:hypothetical protein